MNPLIILALIYITSFVITIAFTVFIIETLFLYALTDKKIKFIAVYLITYGVLKWGMIKLTPIIFSTWGFLLMMHLFIIIYSVFDGFAAFKAGSQGKKIWFYLIMLIPGAAIAFVFFNCLLPSVMKK